jgi:hypothetical protein
MAARTQLLRRADGQQRAADQATRVRHLSSDEKSWVTEADAARRDPDFKGPRRYGEREAERRRLLRAGMPEDEGLDRLRRIQEYADQREASARLSPTYEEARRYLGGEDL